MRCPKCDSPNCAYNDDYYSINKNFLDGKPQLIISRRGSCYNCDYDWYELYKGVATEVIIEEY